jgi:hypothetical protein
MLVVSPLLMIAWWSQPASLTAGKQLSPSETTDVPGKRCFFAQFDMSFL